MSLWCSLLGHRFEGSQVDRDREERGEEVLTVTREIQTCGRCGTQRVVSESTEVAPVDPAPEHVSESDSTDTTTGGGLDPVEPRDPAEEDTEILEDDRVRAPGEWPPEPGQETATSDAADSPVAAATADTPTTFACPECGYETDASGSPLRDGDSCPECQVGYLEST